MNDVCRSYCLVADSGSTKTAWCLFAVYGEAERYVMTKGLNPSVQDGTAIQAVLDGELRPQIDRELKNAEMLHIFFFGAGCTAAAAPEMRERLMSLHDNAFVEVHSDMLGAARALAGNREGIVCILGTGSNSCLYDGENIVCNTPPLGYVLGDEGSGAVLGKTLVGNLLKGIFPSTMKEDFLSRFGLTEATIIENVYRRPAANRFLASFAPFIYENKKVDCVHRMLVKCFEDFFVRNVDAYGRNELKVNFVGSIACFFEEELREAALHTHHIVGNIVQNPIERLVAFYHERMCRNKCE